MEKDKQTEPDIDVTDEKYAGPSAHIAALGTGVVKHLKWAFIGLGIGAVGAWVAPGRAKQIIELSRTTARELKVEAPAGANLFIKGVREIKYAIGSVMHMMVGDDKMANEILDLTKPKALSGCEPPSEKTSEWLKNSAMSKEQGFGNFFVSHVVDLIPGYGKKIKTELRKATENPANARGTYALTFGGILAFGGYVTGWAAALVTGAHRGNQGKHQFDRAKEQIKNLQEDNADLNKINDELHAKYVKAATRLDTIQAAQDNAARAESALASEIAAPSEAAAAPTTEVQLAQNQHQGKLAEKELAVA